MNATDITKNYHGHKVLNGISMQQIQPGDGIAFVGANGCGKSTLLCILAGLTNPDQGHVAYIYQIVEGELHEYSKNGSL